MENEIEDGSNHNDASVIPYDDAISMVTTFDGLISSFSGIPKVSSSSCFTALSEAGLSFDFPTNFDQAIENILSNAKSFSNALRSQINQCKEDDIETENNIPNSPPKKKNNLNSGGGGSGNNVNSNNESAVDLVDNADKQLDIYENMSMSDLKEVLSTLVSTANSCDTDLTTLINDSSYSEKIKEALLNNVNLNQDLKDLYEVADSTVIQKLLNSIVNGSQSNVVGLDNETVLAMKEYLATIANNNEITFEEFITNESYSSEVKTALKEFGSVYDYVSSLNDENLQESFGNIYDGNNVGNQSSGVINSLRFYISAVSDNNNISSEELLFNKDNSSILKSGVNNLGKSSLYADTISNCSSSSVSEILNSLLIK